ncbi:hypothetical protein L2E82_05947 [Cichorium intybus]|uniref:Uncharacterized protein n=1 Tax=Cichorium intybus TaxID=13427 RepID=A0ACB9H956_CICIN|nr:hypothetical protein L2E82_05947 [Cichorium intybus]
MKRDDQETCSARVFYRCFLGVKEKYEVLSPEEKEFGIEAEGNGVDNVEKESADDDFEEEVTNMNKTRNNEFPTMLCVEEENDEVKDEMEEMYETENDHQSEEV